jgi:hypothetical protein
MNSRHMINNARAHMMALNHSNVYKIVISSYHVTVQGLIYTKIYSSLHISFVAPPPLLKIHVGVPETYSFLQYTYIDRTNPKGQVSSFKTLLEVWPQT